MLPDRGKKLWEATMDIGTLIAVAGIIVGLIVGVPSLIYAIRADSRVRTLQRDIQIQTIDFELKRNEFVGYLHGRKSHKLGDAELKQVDNQLALFGPPRTSLASPPLLSTRPHAITSLARQALASTKKIGGRQSS
jgi:hypothetical protein